MQRTRLGVPKKYPKSRAGTRDSHTALDVGTMTPCQALDIPAGLLHCYGLNCVPPPPPNSYVEALTFNVTVFEDKALRR